MAILSSQATKRDAKSYFGRFGLETGNQTQSEQPGQSLSNAKRFQQSKTVHTALLKLCHADNLSRGHILPGLAKTIVQLGRLGMPICIIVETEDTYHSNQPLPIENPVTLREKYGNLIDRIVDAIEREGGRAQPVLGDLLTRVDGTSSEAVETSPSSNKIVADIQKSITIPQLTFPATSQRLLHNMLKRGQIPVIAPIVSGLKPSLSVISADAALFRICQALSNHTQDHLVSVERIIVVDPVGGLPATERPGGSHIYINLQQEYDQLLEHLSNTVASVKDLPSTLSIKLHLRNLIIVDKCLALLKSTSSGLITTPTIAAATPSQTVPQPLIHNLLTDKPMISPSLPTRQIRTPKSHTTLLRRGLPVAVYRTFEAGDGDRKALDLTRLVRLIEDSFGRRLNADHYYNRIRDKTAAIIVAGDYEGAAIVTAELPFKDSSHVPTPYLDKFAVSSKSQGSGSVADIVFNVLTSMFPDDLIWRSRKTNPVNKWVSLCHHSAKLVL
jgi:amino-acid N-acetyltransferase